MRAVRGTTSTSSSPHLRVLASNKLKSKMKKNKDEWTNQGEKEKYCTGEETPVEASIPCPGISASAGEDTL